MLLHPLPQFQWFRRLAGGRWEHWWIDSPVASAMWLDVVEFSRITGERPPLARGTCIEENWK
jgi:hypothetical protein